MKRPFKDKRPIGPFFQREREPTEEQIMELDRTTGDSESAGFEPRTGSSSTSRATSSTTTTDTGREQKQEQEQTNPPDDLPEVDTSPDELVDGGRYAVLVRHDMFENDVVAEVREFIGQSRNYRIIGDSFGEIERDKVNGVFMRAVKPEQDTVSGLMNDISAQVSRVDGELIDVDIQRIEFDMV